MKLSVFAACVVLAGATAMAAPVSQATPPKAQSQTPKAAAAVEKPKMLWASGAIEKFDAATKTLTVKHDGKEVTYAVDDQTHVMKGKEALTTSALTGGQNVRIEYTVAGTNRSAHVIELSAGKTMPAKK